MEIKKIITVVVAAAIGGAAAMGLSKAFDKKDNMTFEEKQRAFFASLPAGKLSEMPDFVGASALSTPTVVHIKTTISEAPSQGNEGAPFDPFGFFGDKSPFGQRGPQQASGSGVIISDDGYLVTNNHVIDGADKIEVILSDKRSYTAELVGKDANTDIALLKIDETRLPFIQFANSDDVRVGEWVLAVGNPFNLTSTVTAGIVSAKGRNIRLLEGDAPIEAFIQTDAAVNPGNSGGALVNKQGQLIGINTAIASQTGSYAGYSFAVPVEIVKKVVQDFKDFGEVQRGFLGIQIRDVDQKLADEKGLKDIKGVYVEKVNDNSAAEKAGIKEGDVILKIENVDVNTTPELQEQVTRHRPGQTLKVEAKRGSESKLFSVILKGKDGKTSTENKLVTPEKASLKGTEFSGLTREEKMKAKVTQGIKVSKVGDTFKKINVPQGFIITHIDKKPVYTVQDVKKSLEEKKEVALISGINPDGSKGYYAIPLDTK
ncbi:MAG: Do family serine endopeptidase [Bacteroidetes bacterium]|nr:Do family serine endopeptidase [Bacteroidota bacterium]